MRLALYPVLLLSLCLALPVQSQTPLGVDQVRRSLDKIDKKNVSEAEKEGARNSLQQSLAHLEQRDEYLAQLATLKKTLQEAPRLTVGNRAELRRLRASAPDNLRQRHSGLGVPELIGLQSEREQQLGQWQSQLNEASNLVLSAQTRPERAQSEIARSQQRSQVLEAELKSGQRNGKALTEEQEQELNAELLRLEAYSELLRQELQGNNLLMDLGNSQRELLELRIARREQENLVLQSMIIDKRRQESEQAIAELTREAGRSAGNSLLAAEGEENASLSSQLLKTTDRLNELTRENSQVRGQLENVRQTSQALDEQIKVLEGSLLLAKILQQQKHGLPEVAERERLADEIADIRLLQFEINKQREELANPESYVEQALTREQQRALEAGEEPLVVSAATRQHLVDSVRLRGEILERLSLELNALLNECITLQLNQAQLKSISNSLRQTLDEQLFWIPSRRALDLQWLQNLPERILRQIGGMPWMETARQLYQNLWTNLWLFLPVVLLIGALLYKRRALGDKLDRIERASAHLSTDSQWHTPLAVLLNILLALPVSLTLLIGSVALRFHAQGDNAYLADALAEMALAWLVVHTSYRLLKAGGLAERHFRWPADIAAFLHRQVGYLGLLLVPLIAVVSIAQYQPDSLSKDYLGLSCVLVGNALLVALLLRALLSPLVREKAPAMYQIAGWVFLALPLALVIASIAGYYYTVLRLTDRMIDSLYLLLLWALIEALLVRGLTLAATRIDRQRTLSREEAPPREGGEEGDMIEEPMLDINQINRQSMRLTRLALLAGFGLTLYWVWADLISVFSYLNHVTLYEYTSGVGDKAVIVPLSLGDLISVGVIAALTVVLARNLPGLLEVVVLSRLNLAQGSAYATTTLLSYVIFAVGAVSSLSILGVSWDKLQWLVAALSVGIGFGMQEIFANFISGLILLFERPVRIGDTVTIDGLTGIVNRIKIRATTIIDSDRKEIIVPNKAFITSMLVNWSLTDTVTRVKLLIGVAYGSDLELVRKLLLQAANENERVLQDPEPMVFFLNFGESTLDHELRIHVRELGDRNMAIDEINRFIDREFRNHGIEIAFRQMEVNIKNLQGQEITLRQEPPQSGKA